MSDIEDVVDVMSRLSPQQRTPIESISTEDPVDVLGLQSEIKVVNRQKNVKLDEAKLLSSKGLPYIHKNRSKIRLNSKDEFKNMRRLVNFYKLWAHNLYPKANFQDCLSLIDGAGKSAIMRHNRNNWIQAEIDAHRGFGNGLSEVFNMTESETANNETIMNTNDNDVSIIPNSNGLFVGEDDEIYGEPIAVNESTGPETTTPSSNQPVEPLSSNEPSQTQPQSISEPPAGDSDFDDDFDDDMDLDALDQLASKPQSTQQPSVDQELAEMEQANEEDYEDEFSVLREMGM